MKSISIPTHNNPFTVIINNREYTYKGGETIEVPDEVAEAIEDALELVPKPKRYLSKLASLVDRSITEVKEEDLAGATCIAENAFYHCDKLIRVEIPNSVTEIDYNVFVNCFALESITIGDGVTSIPSSFSGCNNLTYITLGSSVRTISAHTFGGLTAKPNSVVYTFKSTKPPSIWIGTYSLHKPEHIKEIRVPKGCVDTYKSWANYEEYADLIVEDNKN